VQVRWSAGHTPPGPTKTEIDIYIYMYYHTHMTTTDRALKPEPKVEGKNEAKEVTKSMRRENIRIDRRE
jgi:hypothetical protein